MNAMTSGRSKTIEPEEYPDDTKKAEVLPEPDRTLKDNNFEEPVEDLRDYSESYSILLGLVTIETQVNFRSLTHKKSSAEPTDDLQSFLDYFP